MEKYRITINDKVYEVEVEKLDGDVQLKKSEPTKVSEPTPSASGQVLNSPIQGSVLKVLVSPGQEVKRGEPVCVIEAMKLENDVVSEVDGVIDEVFIDVRQVVDSGQPLVSYRG